MGVLMLALYLAVANLEVHAASGLPTVFCGAAINLLAVIIFAARGALDYKRGIPMLVAGIAGGYLGAHGVKKLDPTKSPPRHPYVCVGADGVFLRPPGAWPGANVTSAAFPRLMLKWTSVTRSALYFETRAF
jgi:hypothetical protein